MIVDLTASTLIVAGLAFYTAGTVGLLHFPDQRSRVHALSKADNLGLGLVLAGAALAWGDPRVALTAAVVWLLALASATVSARVVAEDAAAEEDPACPR